MILIFGNGFEFSDSNVILYRRPQRVLGENHMYADTVGGVRPQIRPRGPAKHRALYSPHARKAFSAEG